MSELVIFVNKSNSDAGWLYSQKCDRSILQCLEACGIVDKLIEIYLLWTQTAPTKWALFYVLTNTAISKGDRNSMKIKVINPNTTATMTHKIDMTARGVAAPETEVITCNPAMGAASIECHLCKSFFTLKRLFELVTQSANF